MSVYNILVVEDDVNCVNEILEALYNKYIIKTAYTIKEAKKLLEFVKFDLVILDRLLPDGSGIELCKDIKSNDNIPVIFLTVIGDKNEVAHGLNIGADDYIVKPFSQIELQARVSAQLRKNNFAKNKIFEETVIGSLKLNHFRQRAYINDVDILLKPKEFMILSVLIDNINKDSFMSVKQIYEIVWGNSIALDFRTVKVNISTLRTKLNEFPNVPIKIIFNLDKGYKIEL